MAGTEETVRLDRHFDALLFGDPPPLDQLDSKLAATLADIHGLRAEPPPHSVFVARLEQELMEIATRVPPTQTRTAVAGANGRVPARCAGTTHLPMPIRTTPSQAWFATAALIAVTVVASLGMLRLGTMQRDDRGIPLSAVQTDTAAGVCQVQPRQIVPAPPRTGTAGGLLPTSPDGKPSTLDSWGVAWLQEDAQPADSETVARITNLLGELAACQSQPDAVPARVFALFSDTYLFFALDMPAMSPPRDITGQSLSQRLAALPQPTLGSGKPEIEGVWMLPEGEAGAVVRPRTGPAYYMVFTWAGDRWLIDELAVYPFPAGTVIAIATPPAEMTAPLELAAVAMFDILYVPHEVKIPANEPVTVALTNAGQVVHTFVVDALGIDVRLQPGETKTITIDAPPGVYDYYCDIPGHRGAGMIGTLTVVSSETP